MACNTPIIASFDTDSDLADVIRDSGAGVCVEPGDVDALINSVQKFYVDNKFNKKSDYDMRSYVRMNASKETCVKKYIDVIKNLMSDYA